MGGIINISELKLIDVWVQLLEKAYLYCLR